MTPRLEFEKYEGLGNDFVIVSAAAESAFDPQRVRALCDRHFGIGADGVLLALPPRTPGAALSMVVLNADGSRPEGCGNGLRCIAHYWTRRSGAPSAELVIDTDAGPRRALVEPCAEDHVADVTVSMGRASELGPMTAPFRDEPLTFERISMGNPHAVAFDVRASEAELDELGPRVSAAVPSGSNVELVTGSAERGFDVLVWERGVGRTLACGTGAAAVAALAALRGRAPFGVPISVALPGGKLSLTVEQSTLEVTLRGAARWVFSGEVSEP
jgi:diaminopimelate epimerase